MARDPLARRILPCAALLVAIGSACASYAQQTSTRQPRALPPQGQTAGVPIGAPAGGAQSGLAATIENPSGAGAAASGRELYVKLNCADCHGFDGKGGMGPNLTDKVWRFGGTPAAIYKSIYEGRPQGMPSWGHALPPKVIWQLVAYIQSLGGTTPPSSYQAGLQGDKPGELVAPELNFEQELDGSPPYPASMFKAASGPKTKAPSK